MMTEPIAAVDVPVSSKKSIYPATFAALVEGRIKHRLGDLFGLTHFGVNLTELAPGSVSALFHHHAKQDEFIYVVSGTPTLLLGEMEHALEPGDCCGFKAGSGIGHQLVNRSEAPVVYLEIGDRTPDEHVEYPRDDLMLVTRDNGEFAVAHKDGRPYE